MPAIWRSGAIVICLMATIAACGRDAGVRDSARDETLDGDSIRPRYVTTTVTGGGSIEGEVENAAPRDGEDGRLSCSRLTVRSRRSPRPEDEDVAVVWLADIRSGKALALDRRFELVADACGFTPKAQPVLAGGTINIRNADSTEHALRFLDDTGRKLRELDLIPGAMVVPIRDVLARPRRIRVTCEKHPHEMAWLLVFDHPYVAATEDQSFALDSVPPGRYRIVAWAPGRGIVDDSVTVDSAKTAEAMLRFP